VEYQNLYAVIAPLIDLLARYLVPLMTMAVIVIRSSVMITSDLEGLRRLGQLGPPGELDAEAFRRVFLPRLAGIVVGSVGLCCVATALATVAMISVVAGHPSVAGMDYLRTVAPESGVQAALLGSIYGVIVALVSLHHGLLVKPGSTEMPRAASLAMVKSVAYCTAVTALLPLVQS
jgi:ABC-type transporter Mla maintaining outer membrane lipid asymmetry permease subunit MlaE